MSGNPLKYPPLEVANRGIEEIAKYFQQFQCGKDYLYEAKLLIVGEAGAGKTTLAKKIQNPNYQLQEEDSTQGIDVITHHFSLPNQENFRINIWDFGGQEIYHATHQFFLTKRSLYALVIDNRKEDDNLYYWLNIVELLSHNSPLVIIKNEKQDRAREINELGLRGQFSNLEKTFATNLKTNHKLEEIITAIQHYISNLPHVGDILPKTWKQVREALERDPRDYISLGEYYRICEENQITEREYQLQLSGYLHDLGVCLRFQDDPLLKKIVILKPEWGTAAVYQALDNEILQRNFGKFTPQDLAQIWKEKQYQDSQDELLQLMIKFKLCYQIPNQNIYIAPQLLTETQPEYPWDTNNNLILRYTYEFMPKGILIQFIVAMHQHIWQQEYVWKSGVILEQEKTLAEVIEYYSKREIKIRVVGKHKRDLLTTVTYELDKIHKSYQRLKYQKLIPCNCRVCESSQQPHFYPFDILRKFEADNQHGIQCQQSYEMVNVRSLIQNALDEKQLDNYNKNKFELEKRGNIVKVYMEPNKEINIGDIGGDFKPMASPMMFALSNISGTVAETIHQSPNTEPEDIEQLLNQLKEAINSSPDLDTKAKNKALKQVQILATAATNPTDEDKKEEAEDATTMLQGIIANLPPAAALVTICKGILPLVRGFLGL